MAETPEHEFIDVSLNALRFDPQNPRVPPAVDGTDEIAVLTWMLSDSSLAELMGSIASHGYFPGDPLLVSPWDEKQDGGFAKAGTFRVVEGNRRLAALKLLSGTVEAPRRRSTVEELRQEAESRSLDPVVACAFPERDAILDYLGYRHITGIKEWDPLEKARYLRQLRERGAAKAATPTNTELARTIGSKGPYVGRLLAGLEALERLSTKPAMAESEINVDDVPFSLLTTAFNHDGIVHDLLKLDRADDPELDGVDEEGLEKLGKWLFVPDEEGKTALEDSRNMGLLSSIVASPKAVEALDEGMPIKDAALLAHQPEEVLMAALEEAEGRLRIAGEHAEELDRATQTLLDTARSVSGSAGEVETKIKAKTGG